MMGAGNFTDDFKRDAVAQITERVGNEIDRVRRSVSTSGQHDASR